MLGAHVIPTHTLPQHTDTPTQPVPSLEGGTGPSSPSPGVSLTQEAQWAQGPTPLWDLENIISFNIIKENMNLIHPRLFLPLQQCNHNSSFYFI